jgi:muramoyltetrapeptide carboxypeptidase
MARRVRIGVVAAGSRFPRETAERVVALAADRYGDRVELVVHPNSFQVDGHFAGTDAERAEAFVQTANDPTLDAVWFARGGYGAGRLIEGVLSRLESAAKRKTYLGYSDAGALLGALYAAGFSCCAHGPMLQDIVRPGGEAAVLRALAWLVDRDPSALEPELDVETPQAAFNLTILGTLIGTPWQPDLTGHVLLLEEVSEHLYRIDRAFFHLTSNAGVRRVAGIRLGRCSDIPENDPAFGCDEAAIAMDWCARSGVPWLGRADIGHDVGNKVVPFGRIGDSPPHKGG